MSFWLNGTIIVVDIRMMDADAPKRNNMFTQKMRHQTQTSKEEEIYPGVFGPTHTLYNAGV